MDKTKEIEVEAVKNAQDSHAPCVVLDVRTDGEVARAKIQGSVHIPLDKLAVKISSVIPDKESTIYVYCLSGSRSIGAVDTLSALGYSHVYSMSHGLLAWRAKGYPLIP